VQASDGGGLLGDGFEYVGRAGYVTVALDNRSGVARSWPNDVKESNGAVLCVGSLSFEGADNTAVLWRVTSSNSNFNVETYPLVGGDVATTVNSLEEIVGDGSTYDEDAQLWLNAGLYWSDRAALAQRRTRIVGISTDWLWTIEVRDYRKTERSTVGR
jgi:hypothetical protein